MLLNCLRVFIRILTFHKSKVSISEEHQLLLFTIPIAVIFSNFFPEYLNYLPCDAISVRFFCVCVSVSVCVSVCVYVFCSV